MKKYLLKIKSILLLTLTMSLGFYCIPMSWDSSEICGDSTCSASESVDSCPLDCSPGSSSSTTCPDAVCGSNESSITCPADCGTGLNIAPVITAVSMNESAGVAVVNLTAISSSGIAMINAELYDQNGNYYGMDTQFDFTFPTFSTDYTLVISHNAPVGTKVYPRIYVDDIYFESSDYNYVSTVSTTNYAVNSIDTNYLDTETFTAIPYATTTNVVACGDSVCSGSEDSTSCSLDCTTSTDNAPPTLTAVSFTGSPTGAGGGYATNDVITVDIAATDTSGVSVSGIYFYLKDDIGNTLGGPYSVTNTSGSNYSGTMTIGSSYASFAYIRIYLTDTLGNIGQYSYYPMYSSTKYTLLDLSSFTYTATMVPLAVVTLEPQVPICGDSNITTGEQCDDGNTINGDGCSSTCTIEGVVSSSYNFDNGTLQGWTISGGLWHLTTTNSASPIYSIWYADPVTGTYSTGAQTAGALVSPSITLGASPMIVFQYALDNEYSTGFSGSFDKLTVEVSTNNGTSWIVVGTALPDTGGIFTAKSESLSAYALTTVKIRFFFDSGDGITNSYSGALIDSIYIY